MRIKKEYVEQGLVRGHQAGFAENKIWKDCAATWLESGVKTVRQPRAHIDLPGARHNG